MIKLANLKEETLADLRKHGKSAEDVRWVGTSGREFPLDVFWKEADRTYDDGFGGAEVNECLMVVGDDWWLERHEYDGSEWWEYKEHPSQPIITEAEDPLHLIFSESFFW